MDIVSTTESSALKLEYDKKTSEAQNLRKDVLRILKISIYPFDKGQGLVRIKTNYAIKKIKEQIGDTEIIKVDPTPKFACDIRKALSVLNKKSRLSKNEYENLYPSDPLPPRMYGTMKAHKPEKKS